MSEKLSAARVQTDDALKLVEIERMRADEIRKAQQKIEESDTRYQNIIKTTAEGFWLVDDVGSLLEVNDAYIEMSGFSRKELVQMNIADLEAAESLIEVQTHLKKVAQAGLDRFETMHRRKDGSIWPVEISVNFVHNNEDLYYVFLRDITERKRIEGKVIDYSKMLEKSMEGTLLAISHMVEQRDPYTAGHERRVGVIASDIAHEMGWVANKCKELEWIGLVHDIGKIGVPAEILSKPGKLTHAEYELVKEHAQRGYEILKDVPFPMPIADIIHQHHERMDGSGYPRQLKGDEIMPEARILIVADVVESIASHRPYRAALGLSFAVQEITKHRGVLYDAEVVDTFLRLVNEKKYQLPA
jgi:PAS domain S-box-containing protein/putative nucleotidyltransferase with HDIG domain